MSPFLWLILGFILIFLEFFMPGGILGVMGGIFILISLVVFSMQSGSPIAIALYVIGTTVCLIFIIRYALYKIRHSKTRFNIYLNQDQEGFMASTFDQSAVGKKGTVLSDLKPGGYILIEGKQHQAISQSGYLPKGSEVIVIGGQEESLIVKLSKKEKS